MGGSAAIYSDSYLPATSIMSKEFKVGPGWPTYAQKASVTSPAQLLP